MKMTQLMQRAIVIGIVGAIGFCEIAPSSASPVFSSTALVKTTAPDMIDQVRVRRRASQAIYPGIALGVLGAVAGAIATQNQYNNGPGYYGPAPGYYGPAPGYYDPAPGYYGPAPGYYGPAPGYYGPAPRYSGRRLRVTCDYYGNCSCGNPNYTVQDGVCKPYRGPY